MTQARDVKDIKDKVENLETSIHQVKDDVSDVRRGVTVQMTKFKDELEAVKAVVDNNTKAWIELRGTLAGINMSVKVLVAVIATATPFIIAFVG